MRQLMSEQGDIMNYHIRFTAKNNSNFDTILRLFIESAQESDYMVQTVAHKVLSPYSSIMLEVMLIGSSKQTHNDVVADFDCVYKGETKSIMLNPNVLGIRQNPAFSHRWAVAGAVFKIVPDLSPAYITSYLLENKLTEELSYFKLCSSAQLPAAVFSDVMV